MRKATWRQFRGRRRTTTSWKAADRRASDESIVIDVAEVVASSIKMNSLWSHGFRMSQKSCIFTVPNILSRHNEGAYKPTAFSIGPLHHSKSHPKHTQNIKFQYLHNLVSRVDLAVEILIGAVAELEPEAREHYGERINLSSAEFVEVLVLDGCFIIELLRKCSDPLIHREPDDPIFNMSCMSQHVLHDLMLLENQVPWMVLNRLFTLTSDKKQPNNPEYSLPLLAWKFYQFVLPVNWQNSQELADHLNLEIFKTRHILDLLREVLIESTCPQEKKGLFIEDYCLEGMTPIPSATELENAGITLKKKIKSSGAVAISFMNGVLEVSPILIGDTTEALFRNIIAFEQCCPRCPTAFTSYAILLDNLINTTEDLSRLQREGIISSMLNPDDAIDFFNKLYKDTLLNEFYYSNVCLGVHAYCRRKWPRWRAALVRNYFSNPWVIASTFAACVLLVMTFLQTLYTMKG